MRAAKLAALSLGLFLSVGCGNKDRNDSIDVMNKGVEAAKNGSFQTAIKAFEEAVRIYPQNHLAWYQLGLVHGKSNHWKDAVSAFEQAVKSTPDSEMYQMQLGIAHYENGNRSMAAEHLEKAIQLNPDLYRAHWYLGRVHRDEDRPKEAAEAWTRAATLNPLFGEPFVRLGELYLQWDMVSEAIDVLEQAKEHVVDEQEQSQLYHYLGLAYEEQRNWDKAITAYSRAIKLRSDNLDAKFQRGLAYMKKGDKSKAKADLEEYANSGGGSAFNRQEANKALLVLAAE